MIIIIIIIIINFQGNTAMFGPIAGRQCVALSLHALICNHRSSISSSADLVYSMNFRNEIIFCPIKIVQPRLFTIKRIIQYGNSIKNSLPDGI